VESVCQEIAHYGAEYGKHEPIRTIYFGGGTPSLLLPSEINQILESMARSFDVSDLEEVTFEINPENAAGEYLRDLRSLGVSRLSVGIQSFFDSDLAFMHRCHSGEQARDAVSNIEKIGFNSWTADLIFSLPEQPREYWAANLEILVGMDAPHISTYGLTVEERTPLWKQIQRGLISPVSEDRHNEEFLFAIDYLRQAGYEHYEISSFALDGHRSLHNHRYWSHDNYIGFGPSAHSFWWRGLPARRWSNVRNLNQYQAFLSGHTRPIDFQENLSLDTLASEYVMLRLRTSDGIDLDVMESRYGLDIVTEKIDEIALLESSGFIEPLRNQRLRLTDSGKTICNTITERLMPS
jgi:putative oxygen-independent coproporphyrinogen III oxidase